MSVVVCVLVSDGCVVVVLFVVKGLPFFFCFCVVSVLLMLIALTWFLALLLFSIMSLMSLCGFLCCCRC